MAEGDRRSDHCLNCGHPVDDEFCPTCGQRNTHYRVSFWRLFGEVVGETFELDGRMLRTLVPFLLRPGVLTCEYVQGHRVSYTSPVRIFIFLTLVFFFTLSVSGASCIVPDDLQVRRTTDGDLAFSSAADHEKMAQALAGIGKEVVREPRAGERQPSTAMAEHDETATGETDLVDGQTPEAFREPIERLSAMEPTAAADALIRSAIEHAPKVVFASVPIFALFLKLLYIRRKRFYFEHLVFSLHFYSFAMLAWTIAAIVGDDLLVFLLLLASIVYLLLAMRKVYEQPWGKTVVKWLLLLGASGLLLLLGVVATTVLAVLLV